MKSRKRIDVRRIKLTPEERAIEDSDEYVPLGPEVQKIVAASAARAAAEIRSRRKDAILHIRINSHDLIRIKEKAKEQGVPYQTFIAQFLHHLAT